MSPNNRFEGVFNYNLLILMFIVLKPNRCCLMKHYQMNIEEPMALP